MLEPSDNPKASLTPQAGLLGTGITLNGKLLTSSADGTVPQLTPAAVPGNGSVVRSPAHSIAFYIFPSAFHPDCPWSSS